MKSSGRVIPVNKTMELKSAPLECRVRGDIMNNVKDLATQKRLDAKRLFGEAIERNGWLNSELPMAKFVDAVIDAAVLEIAAIQQEAMKHVATSDNP